MMKHILFMLLSAGTISTAITAQTYSTYGSIIPVAGPGNGGASYSIAIPDEFSVSMLKVRVVAHVVETNGDATSTLGNLGVQIDKMNANGNHEFLYLLDHNCSGTSFSTFDVTFSDAAADNFTNHCLTAGYSKVTAFDRTGAPQTDNLAIFNGTNNSDDYGWNITVTWKPYTGGPPDLPLSVDSIELIFNESALDTPDHPIDREVVMYPNPVNNGNDVIIRNDNAEAYGIRMYDLLGQLVFQQANNQGHTSIATSALNSGLYLVELCDDRGKILQKKLTIQ